MSFRDAFLLLSDAQALTATAVSTNTIDLGDPTVKRRVGSGEPIGLEVTVDAGADITTGDETYEIQAISSAAANLSSHTVIASRVVAAAALGLGKKVVIPIPTGSPTQRYLGARYVLAGTTPLLTVTASVAPLSMISEEPVNYARGYAI